MSNYIRVNREAQKIEVNDSGDFIMLELKNTTFMSNLIGLMRELEANSKSLLSQVPQTECNSVEEVSAVMDQAAEVCGRLAERTDEVFGAGTCRKVFGDIVPGIELFDDFFTQLMPYFEQFGKERAKRLSKYSAARTGNV